MCALAEVAWSPKEKRSLLNFLNRLDVHYGRLDELDVNYRWPRLEGFNNKNVFIDKTNVEFISQRKGTEIRYTMDGSAPTKNSLLYTEPFLISETTLINVKEVTTNGISGPLYAIHYIKQSPSKPVMIKGKKEGLKFEYFEFDKPIDSTLDLLKMQPVSIGNIQKFIYPYEIEKLPERFGLIFNGFIEVPKEGVYIFSVLSNDGTRLYIDDQLIVENDGWHGPYEKEGAIALQGGLHKIKLLYFQAGAGKALKVFMKSNRSVKKEISDNIFSK
jgi:hexosaminidase